MPRPLFAPLLTLSLALALSACDDPDPRGEPDTHSGEEDLTADTGSPDTSSTVDTTEEDVEPDTREEDSTQADAGSDTADLESDADTPPAPCDTGSACNALLDTDGGCPGDCIPQPRGASCPGIIAHGLCYDIDTLRSNAERYNLPDGLWAELGPLPDEAAVGDTVTLRVTIHNPTDTERSPHIRAWSRLPVWSLTSTDFANDTPLTLPPQSDTTLTLTLRAERASVFDPDDSFAAFVNVGSTQIGVNLFAGFGQSAELTCGTHTFPTSWCSGTNCERENSVFYTGRCCDDVFYPSATCCADSDCANGGSCFDGVCIAYAPNSITAPSPLIGRQHILVLDTDLALPAPADPCAHNPAAFDALGLTEVDTWLRGAVSARTGRDDILDIRWRVLHIPDAESILTAPDRGPRSVAAQLEAHLLSQGCLTQGLVPDVDRTLIVSSLIALGGPTGRAFDVAQACAISPWPRSLMTHELAHLYGALDRYTTSAGELQWRSALMSRAQTASRGTPPSDAVLWGEAGLGDVDRSGVIDVFEFTIAPDTVTLSEVRAVLSEADGRLSVYADFAAQSGDTSRPHPMPQFRVELLDHAADAVGYLDRADFYGFSAVGIGDTLRVRIRADYHHTTQDWSRRHLAIDEEQTVTVVGPAE